MENEEKQIKTEESENPVTEEKIPYVPRPAWQVWGARIGLVLMIIIVIMSYLRIASGNFG